MDKQEHLTPEPQILLEALKLAEASIQKLWDSFDWTTSPASFEPFIEAIATHNRIHDTFLKISKRFWPWAMDAEPGDIMVDKQGRAFRLYASKGRNKRDAGELSCRERKEGGKIAVIENGRRGGGESPDAK